MKHDLKESVEVFMDRNLDPPHRRDRQGERRLALPHRRHRPAKLPLTDVTDRLNDPVTEVTDRLNDPFTDVTDNPNTTLQRSPTH